MNPDGFVNTADNHRASLEEWAESLVGRYWEVYWRQEQGRRDGTEDNDSRAQGHHDHTDSQLEQSLVPLTKENQLAGKDSKASGLGPGSETESQNIQEGERQTNHGCDGDNHERKSDEGEEIDDGSSSSSVSHADDWYDAKIESYCHSKTTTISANEPAHFGALVFSVTFVGDDNTVYEMNLTPDLVRPSARAWIRRTLALLGRLEEGSRNDKGAAAEAVLPSAPAEGEDIRGVISNVGAAAEWFESLPPDTSTPQDHKGEKSLRNVRHAATVHDLPYPLECVNATAVLEGSGSTVMANASAAPYPTVADLDSIRELVVQIRWQVHLRKRLEAAEMDHHPQQNQSRAEDPDEAEGPTNEYLDYLLSCLRRLELSCLWYYRCWALHSRMMSDGGGVCEGAVKSPEDLVDRDYVLRDCLDAGRQAISFTYALDVSVSASKRKRKSSALLESLLSSLPESLPQRRGKRRKKRRRLDWDGKKADTTAFLDSLEPEDLLSTETVERFIRRVQSTDSRWFLSLFVTMLRSLSVRVVAPLVAWEQRARLYLGDIESIPNLDDIDGATSNDDSSMGDDDDDQQSDAKSSTFVKYEEIESAIDLAKENTVLQHIQLSDYVNRLIGKLSAIDHFSESAWKAIVAVLDDGGHANESREIKSDVILEELKHLLATAKSKGPPGLSNVEPLERNPSTLTRSFIETAIHYRSWYLRFVQATEGRERVTFAKRVISDFWTLPSLTLPPAALDFTTKVARIARQVKALVMKLSDAESLFNKFSPLPFELAHELTKTEGLNSALKELRVSPFVAEAEEMMAVRLDILSWKSEVTTVFARERPLFSELISVKAKADQILQGRSGCRLESIRGLEADSAVDHRIRDFAHHDLMSMCAGDYEKFESLYSVASSWKERAETVILALRFHGNDAAGTRIASPKLPAMVDLKRVRDLVNECPTISVDFSEFSQTLSRIHSTSVKWAESITSTLCSSNLSFEECLQHLRESASRRPEGIIMSPTRQVLDSVESLLIWYTSVKQACSSQEPFSRYDLIVEGIEILEVFSNSKPDTLFTIAPAEAIILLSSKVSQRCLGKVLSWSKLQSNELSGCILSRMVIMARDVAEGFPLLSLLHALWIVKVEDFTDKCLKGIGNDRLLERARRLMKRRPLSMSTNEPLPQFLIANARHSLISNLSELIHVAESVENEARNAVSESRALLRECLHKPFEIPQHLTKLKRLVASVKSPQNGIGLMYDPTLVQQLDHDSKVFQWLLRALQYPALQSRHAESEGQIDCRSEGDTRVPWEVLVSLFEKLPETGETGDIAYVTVRVKELYEAAEAWQGEISSLTKLSLRGVKRRSPQAPSPPGRSADAATSTEEDKQIDLNKLAELTNAPILLEVAMPRQNAIRTMLSATGTFEAQLQELLGRDYDGVSPDRAAYPLAGSLVGNDDSFLLYRLTKSPLFGELNAAIRSMSEVADKVVADTPGKAAFQWIRKAFVWIESLHHSVRVMNLRLGVSKLVIPCDAARHLVGQGTGILLDVPDDLRRTLSKYKVFVSASKRGKLTVKTMKGGAHHAVGVTAIRWCPLLFESLKADYAKYEKWQKDMGDIAGSFVSFTKQPPSDYEESLLMYHRFYDDVSELLEQAADLVVAPVPSTLENGNRILWGIKSRLSASTPATAAKHAARKYRDPESLIRNRFLLLDSLVRRQTLDQSCEKPSASMDAKDGPFRGAARVLFQTALLNGVSAVGMDNSMQEAMSFCALKAWEIENELYAAFQGGAAYGDSKISPEYRDFARALKRSLEDPDNLPFCIRVLTGEVEASAVAQMSVFDLANPKTKEERARAAASHALVLDGTTTPMARKTPPDEERNSKLVKSASIKLPEPLKKPPPPQTTQKVERSVQNSPLGKRTELRIDLGSSELPLKLADVARTAAASSHRPPPPPSLAASLVAVPSASRRSQVPVTNSSGTDRSNVTVSAGTFVAGFVTESDHDSIAEGLLPENLVEKGRLKDDEFSRFIHSKLGGGKWSVATFRLITFSNKDEREHRKYCKEYESRMRLAMFSLSEDSKVFLVTPNFHASVRSLGFENASSTYAVALVRR